MSLPAWKSKIPSIAATQSRSSAIWPIRRWAARCACQGSFESHPRYGRQFRVESCEVLKPAGLTALERYLSSGQIKGVGPALARRITEHFGEELFAVLDHAAASAARSPRHRGRNRAPDNGRLAGPIGIARADGVPARAWDAGPLCPPHPQALRGALAGGDPQRPLPAGAHGQRNRLSHRRHGRRAARYPAQFNPARARRNPLPARADGRGRARVRRGRLPGKPVSRGAGHGSRPRAAGGRPNWPKDGR